MYSSIGYSHRLVIKASEKVNGSHQNPQKAGKGGFSENKKKTLNGPCKTSLMQTLTGCRPVFEKHVIQNIYVI